MDETRRPFSPMPSPMRFLGLRIDPVTVEAVHRFMDSIIEEKAKAVILNLNVHAVNLSRRDGAFRDCLNRAHLVFCDGEGIRVGMKFLGMTPPEKITYDRWIWQLARHAQHRGYRLFFLGAAEGVAQDAAMRLKMKYPKLEMAGTHHGFFKKQGPENEKVIGEINRAKPDILVVGFGMPIQEKWIQDNLHRIDARVFLAGGAVFECASGKLKSPPPWMVSAKLEWLYRWMQQPLKRFNRYALGLPRYAAALIREKAKMKDDGGGEVLHD